MPCRYSAGEALDFSGSYIRCQAGHKQTGPYRAHLLANNLARLDWQREIQAELEQKLVKDVLFGSVVPNVFNTIKQCTPYVVRLGLPAADVGCVEPQHAKTEIAGECGVFTLDPLGDSAKAFL